MSARLSIHYRCACGEVQVWTYRERIPEVTCSACATQVVRHPDPTVQQPTPAERAIVDALVAA